MKDVIERNHLREDNIMDQVVDVLASSVGSLTNANKLANTFNSNGIKTSDKIVKAYIEHLKYYYTDIGY